MNKTMLLRDLRPGDQRDLDLPRRNAGKRGSESPHEALLGETGPDPLFDAVALVDHRVSSYVQSDIDRYGGSGS
jgi:hypothetical protein